VTGTIVARASGATAPDGSARLTAPLRPGTGEGPAPSANRWRTSIVIFVLTAVINALLVIAVLAALDPYDTGRFAIAPLWRDRIDREKNSRGRDPQFDSAIFGNSRIELLRPELLDKNTGMRFVSLPILGAEPIEEFVLLRYFLRHHSNPRALVIGLDETWCFNPLQSELTAEYRDWTRVVDCSVDRPENRIDENYFDNVHYRTPIATAFGQDIADDLDAALSE